MTRTTDRPACLCTLLAVTALLLSPVPAALAAPGDLDASFGGTGIVKRSGSAVDAAVQPDGKVVRLTREFEIARYTVDGTLDPTFGTGGVVVAPGGNGDAITVQPDGRIVAVGDRTDGSDTNFLVRRYLPDGTPDAGFGTDGAVVTPVAAADGADRAFAVAVAPDGKLVVAGCTSPMASCGSPGPSEGSDTAVVRYAANGTLDPSFGGEGRATVVVGAGARGDQANGVAVRPDGGVVLGGTADTRVDPGGPVDQDFAVTQLSPGGQRDRTFSDDGIVTVAIEPGGERRDDGRAGVVLQPDGKVLVAGQSGPSSTVASFAVARLDAAGALDPGFGTGGVVRATTAGVARGLALQSDGKAVLVGHDGQERGILAVRYTAAGAVDPSFGNQGQVAVAGDDIPAVSVRADADDRLILSGGTGVGFVARLAGDDRADLGFRAFPRPSILYTAPGSDSGLFFIHNRGPKAARAVTLDSSIPAGATVSSLTTTQGSCTLTARIGCALGDLPAGGEAQVRFRFAVESGGRYSFLGTVDSSTVDPVRTNNTFDAGTFFASRLGRPLQPPKPIPAPDVRRPRLTSVRLARQAFRRIGGSTRLAFTLSEAAKVRVTFSRVARVRGRERLVRLSGALVLDRQRGRSGLTFTARLADRTRRVASGRYRVALVATDRAGNRAAAVRRRFTIRR
ncbi:MAG: hypothetical protein M3417_13165 [Actinomycetota bacterium]|nr:hypothetical protein [Actinomycetota bacterium]